MKANSKAGVQYKMFVRRFEHSVVYRLKDRDRIERAMKLQDEIRSRAKGGIDLTKEIRRWRDVRYSKSNNF